MRHSENSVTTSRGGANCVIDILRSIEKARLRIEKVALQPLQTSCARTDCPADFIDVEMPSNLVALPVS